jgi:hypothetical protein
MLALDPDDILPVSLKSDAEKPEATRPAVLVKAMTGRLERRYRPLMKAASDAERAGDVDLTLTKLAEAIGVVFAGTVNIPGVNSAGDLEDVCTTDELWELAVGVREATVLPKKSGGGLSSPSTSLPAEPARAVATLAGAVGAPPIGSLSA